MVGFLNGNLVELRPINFDHISIFAAWWNHASIRKYSRSEIPVDSNELETRMKKNTETKRSVLFEIWHIADNKLIGIINFHGFSQPDLRAEFGVTLGALNYRQKGCAFEASKLLISFGFGELNLHKIILTRLEGNVSSQKLIEKLGAKLECVLKDTCFVDGKYLDEYCYGIFKSDWMKRDGTLHNKELKLGEENH
jgi:RimJ/RimL family protein N-acetyltransferase